MLVIGCYEEEREQCTLSGKDIKGALLVEDT